LPELLRFQGGVLVKNDTNPPHPATCIGSCHSVASRSRWWEDFLRYFRQASSFQLYHSELHSLRVAHHTPFQTELRRYVSEDRTGFIQLDWVWMRMPGHAMK